MIGKIFHSFELGRIGVDLSCSVLLWKSDLTCSVPERKQRRGGGFLGSSKMTHQMDAWRPWNGGCRK
ncbi:hypothetical protein SLEP1_g38698 [Rubroshorea leprosula]|uniref:Uncharacterized protein n=1 Tax=Rubroshorea leprosula TaxID=152421 RepID=A0AAV5KXT3_9ROSI|nr:hypothetical protein SLEP1_g38698 [Rubroshorea leprosula]